MHRKTRPVTSFRTTSLAYVRRQDPAALARALIKNVRRHIARAQRPTCSARCVYKGNALPRASARARNAPYIDNLYNRSRNCAPRLPKQKAARTRSFSLFRSDVLCACVHIHAQPRAAMIPLLYRAARVPPRFPLHASLLPATHLRASHSLLPMYTCVTNASAQLHTDAPQRIPHQCTILCPLQRAPSCALRACARSARAHMLRSCVATRPHMTR